MRLESNYKSLMGETTSAEGLENGMLAVALPSDSFGRSGIHVELVKMIRRMTADMYIEIMFCHLSIIGQ